jgi:hypothetical protein
MDIMMALSKGCPRHETDPPRIGLFSKQPAVFQADCDGSGAKIPNREPV